MLMEKLGKKNFRFLEKEVIEFFDDMRKDKYLGKPDIEISEILRFNMFINFPACFNVSLVNDLS